MKKILLVLAVSMLIGVVFSACHAYEDCPAYGQIEDASKDQNS